MQYWALHPLTCWAEQLRGLDVRDPDEAGELRFRPWVADVELPDGTLHVSFDNAAAQGIEPAALIDDDWTGCQEWAGGLQVSALVVPSAALPGTEIFVLFGPMVRSRWGISPLDPDYELACEPVANLATGVADLLPHVRWHGEPHAGYESWLRGEPAPLAPIVRVDRGASQTP